MNKTRSCFRMNKPRIVCNKCNGVFISKESLRVHKTQNCQTTKHSCDNCDKVFFSILGPYYDMKGLARMKKLSHVM